MYGIMVTTGMSKQVIHGLVTLMKVRVGCEGMDYKCSRPWEQLSGKSWDMCSILKRKQRGPHGQGRDYTSISRAGVG